jgi:hypothetical protein
MKATAAHFAMLITCLALLWGCRSPRPVLEPAKSAERLVEPPPERRYESAESPREAFEKSNGSGGAADPPRSIVPTGGIGSPSNSRTGPYKF